MSESGHTSYEDKSEFSCIFLHYCIKIMNRVLNPCKYLRIVKIRAQRAVIFVNQQNNRIVFAFTADCFHEKGNAWKTLGCAYGLKQAGICCTPEELHNSSLFKILLRFAGYAGKI